MSSSRNGSFYEIKIVLQHIDPAPWRRVVVPANITLEKFHAVIQRAMGWLDCHLHEFESRGQRFGPMDDDPFDDRPPIDERTISLSDLAGPGMEMIYRYDFGDDWEHSIVIEKIINGDDIKAPRCIDGRYACPPEDCGGPWAYAEMLTILAGPSCEERSEFLQWLGGPFDPNKFLKGNVNKRLARIRV